MASVVSEDQEGAEDPGQEYVGAHFVPEEIALKKDGPVYRYLAVGEVLEQHALPEMDQSLPFPKMNFGSVKYKAFVIVTNRDIPGDEFIWWYRGRCGKSERAHMVMKEDLSRPFNLDFACR